MITKTIVTRSGTQIVNLTAEEEETRRQEQEAWLVANPSKTELQIAMQNLRVRRNALLAETDWTVLPDSPISNKTAWQNYRTELRDLTNGLTTVEQIEAVTWPTKPGA